MTRGPRSNDGQMIKAVVMGFSRKRIGRDGKPRYTAYYLDIRGQERSAGTFSNKKGPTRPGRTRKRRSGQANQATPVAADRPSRPTSWTSGSHGQQPPPTQNGYQQQMPPRPRYQAPPEPDGYPVPGYDGQPRPRVPAPWPQGPLPPGRPNGRHHDPRQMSSGLT